MSYAKEETPQRLTVANLVVEELPDELMIYDPDRKKAFCLNQTAASVWKQANGSRTVEEIADLMAKQMGKPVSGEMVRFSLDVLAKDGLLERPLTGAGAATPLGVTRRALLQKFGMGAMALPAVTVLLVSPAKAHASSITMSPGPTTSNESQPHHHGGGFWEWLENLF